MERTIPAMKRITTIESDITGLEMIALRPRTYLDVSLLVKELLHVVILALLNAFLPITITHLF